MYDREDMENEMRRRVRRGLPLPERPDPADLWNACDGDGYRALAIMIDFMCARRTVADEYAERLRSYAA